MNQPKERGPETMLSKFKTYQQAKEFYRATTELDFPNRHVKNQFERAVLSISLNLAEGSGKPTLKERRRFYSIAMGSLREVQAILDILEDEELIKNADRLGIMIWGVIQRPGGR